MTSAARGAAVIVASPNTPMPVPTRDLIRALGMDMPLLLGLAMVVGFLHDANKCLDGGARNNTQVSIDEISLLVHRYGIDAYLSARGWPSRTADAWSPLLRDLLRGTEVNQSDEDVRRACEELADVGYSVGAHLSDIFFFFFCK